MHVLSCTLYSELIMSNKYKNISLQNISGAGPPIPMPMHKVYYKQYMQSRVHNIERDELLMQYIP